VYRARRASEHIEGELVIEFHIREGRALEYIELRDSSGTRSSTTRR